MLGSFKISSAQDLLHIIHFYCTIVNIVYALLYYCGYIIIYILNTHNSV